MASRTTNEGSDMRLLNNTGIFFYVLRTWAATSSLALLAHDICHYATSIRLNSSPEQTQISAGEPLPTAGHSVNATMSCMAIRNSSKISNRRIRLTLGSGADPK